MFLKILSENGYLPIVILLSGRWQAPAAVLPPEGCQRGRGPEGPEDKGHVHSRARRAREWPNMRVRGPEDEQSSVPVSVLASATICFSQLSSKSRNSWAVLKTLMSAKNHENCSGSLYLQYKHRVKKLGQFIDHVKSYATLKFRKNEVFVSKMHRYPDPSLSRLFLA